MTHVIYLGIGSNIDPATNITEGIVCLRQLFGNIQCSPVYESTTVGFSGSNFYNLVIQAETQLPLKILSEQLRAIEIQFGRPQHSTKYSSRHLDIDILLYDDLSGVIDDVELPRSEILKNAFVLKPLTDLAPHLYHPTEKKAVAELWSNFEQQHAPLEKYGQAIWPVELSL